MHSFADTFEQPAVVEIDGKKVALPLLSQRDYLPWIEELTVNRKENATKAAPPASKVMDRARWMDYVENLEVTPGDLQPYVFRAKGTLKVLGIAIKKAGIDEKVGETWVDSCSAKDNEMLAVKVSGLFRREEWNTLYPAEKKKDDKSPNEQTPEDDQPASERTGPSGVPSLRPEHAQTFST